ncbi:hypothetical protein GP486_008286, partial [Trichoglossum hirsutum]
DGGDGDEDEDEVKRELKRVGEKYDPAREGGFSSSSESSSEDEEIDGQEQIPGLPDNDQVQEEADVPMGEVSSRLAVVNLDWDNIRAVDLMAAFSSFKPPQGRILGVAVYPSGFGRERMGREEMEGPPKEIFGLDVEDPRGYEEEEEEEEEKEEDVSEDDEEIKRAMVREDKGEEFDSTKLRRYQLERLRPETAKTIYDATDGTEYLSSANFFDLRFIPDSVSFDTDVPRDEATDVPGNYRPNEFVTDALQHSKVKLTWDADDGVRKEVVRKAFGRREIEEQDLKAYLGSDSSEDEGVELQGTAGKDASGVATLKKETGRKRLRTLLGLDEEDSGSKEKGGPTGDMQITFSSGLAGNSENKRSVFEEPEETTLEKYVRKERERKQRRKGKMKLARTGVSEPVAALPSSDKITDDEKDHDGGLAKLSAEVEVRDEDNEDLGFDDPFFTAGPDAPTTAKPPRQSKEARRAKRELRARSAEAEATKRAELELLMLDDDHIADPSRSGGAGKKLQHFDINDVLKAEKANAKRGKKGAATTAAGPGVQENFKMDVDDPRFSRLWDSHEFAIDPTNPRFRKTEGMRMLLEESRKKRRREMDGEQDGDGGGGGVGGGKAKR